MILVKHHNALEEDNIGAKYPRASAVHTTVCAESILGDLNRTGVSTQVFQHTLYQWPVERIRVVKVVMSHVGALLFGQWSIETVERDDHDTLIGQRFDHLTAHAGLPAGRTAGHTNDERLFASSCRRRTRKGWRNLNRLVRGGAVGTAGSDATPRRRRRRVLGSSCCTASVQRRAGACRFVYAQVVIVVVEREQGRFHRE
mmetsp:Transcript_17207/g.43877  ORF Transcript_17207/g.43877 Transcript_17207/m.43877 type:complete len:200 (+) Transcript_17207:386-985(+)